VADSFIRQPEQGLIEVFKVEDTICRRDIFVKPGLLLNCELNDDILFVRKP
jgi:hypothetical protein